MSYIHIKPTFNCLIKLSNLEKVLNKNKTYSFLCKEDVLNVIVYPLYTTSSSLPFSFKFDTSNPICQKNVDVIKYPNNNYLLTISPFLIGAKTLGIKTKTLTFGLTKHTIYYSLNAPFNVKLESENTFCEYSFNEVICNINFVTIASNLLIYAKLENGLGYVFCNINFENNTYSLVSLEKIDLLENKNNFIYTYKNLNDISHHGEVCKYSIQNQYNKVCYIVYNENSPVIIKHKELIPFAFFEAIKIENFKLARLYLTPELSNKLTNYHFKKFFGKFIKATLPLTHEEYEDEISLIYENKNNDDKTEKYAKNYKVLINENSKIYNILES